MAIRYRITPADPGAHQFEVTLTVAAPAASQEFSLPVWIPGSYLVREFSRHVSGLQARQGSQERPVERLAKNRWRVATSGRAALELRYRVYAFDASVRTAWLDADRGFFNATSLCLQVQGRTAEPHQVVLSRLPSGWEVATAMRPAARSSARTPSFEAADYDELADHPFELGRFWRGRFAVAGVPHEFVVSGAWPSFDGERLLADTQRIVQTQVAFWHGPQGRPPYERYVFLLHATEDGYGGLEHRASTALIAARRDLPRRGAAGVSDGYVTLLGLISHEFFHTWNVKRLKPADFRQLDYGLENYTELLWFFEGFTSYYDDLMLLRAGLVDAPRYLKLVARALNGLAATPGQRVQSVAEASFDAWIKYYRSDENTPNSTVSYYTKGALVGLMLDLALRDKGEGSLDELMRALWREAPEGCVTESLVFALARRLGGRAVAAQLQAWVHDRAMLQPADALARFGVECTADAPSLAAELGLVLGEGPVSGIQVKAVLAGGAAAQAGVCAGDEILAADGWRLRRLEDASGWVQGGAPFELLVVRQQRVRTLTVPARDAADPGRASNQALRLASQPAPAVASRRRAWLGA